MILLTASALYILWVKNPLHAVLGLILVFINSAILVASYEIHFIALVYVVVYVGAICVLFLFVIMLLNLRSTELANQKSYKFELIPYICGYIIFLILYAYFSLLKYDIILLESNLNSSLSNIQITQFVTIFLFENIMQLIILTLLLFLAIVAPIAIASKTTINTKKQDIFFAMIRDINTSSQLLK